MTEYEFDAELQEEIAMPSTLERVLTTSPMSTQQREELFERLVDVADEIDEQLALTQFRAFLAREAPDLGNSSPPASPHEESYERNPAPSEPYPSSDAED